ncbi:MAG: hypothetical protein NXI31_11625 [bacterium]|nr:hypothetical protein [bacterium]
MTSHYEQRLQKDLEWIDQLVEVVGKQLVETIQSAVDAVLRIDRQLAAEIVIGDFTINRQTRELDRLCHAFVARHLPSAGHLRYVSSVLRLNIALERIGDYATTISRTAAHLSEPPPSAVVRDIEMMSEQSRRLLADSLNSFHKRDEPLARATIKAANQFAPYLDRVFADLVKAGEENARPIEDLYGLIATFKRLERVIHQAKNICEETVFVVTGQDKGEKRFQILFVDEKNDGASQLAEHFTRKAFPNSGQYESAGWSPAEEIQSNFVEFAESSGMDLSKSWPTDLASKKPQLDTFDLVVGLTPEIRDRLERTPFHTTLLHWDVDTTATPAEVYRTITPLIRGLMEQLRGEQAS